MDGNVGEDGCDDDGIGEWNSYGGLWEGSGVGIAFANPAEWLEPGLPQAPGDKEPGLTGLGGGGQTLALDS